MGLETGIWVNDLNPANPPGTDPKSQGDDHLRLEKTTVKNSFAGFVGAILITGTDGGAANAYTLTPATVLPAYTSRMIAIFSPTIANTGAATLNVSGLGNIEIRSLTGAALAANDLVPGVVYAASYDGAVFRLLAVTKQYVDNLSFSSTLPAAPGGNTLYFLQSLNGSFFWGTSPVPDFLLFAQGVD